MAADKNDTAIKRTSTSKKKQTVLEAHLYQIVGEDKAAGTFTFKKVPMPPLSKKGSTKTDKIVNGIHEASDAGDTSFRDKDYAIFYANCDFFTIGEETKSVTKKRS